MNAKSSTKKRAATAKLAAPAKSKKAAAAKPAKAAPTKRSAKTSAAKTVSRSPAKTPTKVAATKTAATRAELGALVRRLRGNQIEKVSAEIVAYVKAAGPDVAGAAQELGLLHKAIDKGQHALIEALTAAGVAPMTASPSIDHPHALAAVAGAYFEPDGRQALVERMLARGGDPDVLWPDPERARARTKRRRSALDFAIDRATPGFSSERAVVAPVIELLTRVSSPTTRTHALVGFLLEEHWRFERCEPLFDYLLKCADLELVDHDGLSPLLAAAHRCHPAMFERVYAEAKTKDPRVEHEVTLPLHRGVPPQGGSYPMLRYPAGSGALAIARMVHTRLQQTYAEHQQPSVREQLRESSSGPLASAIADAAAVVAFLESKGHTAETTSSRLEGPLETVRAACSRLAEHLAIPSFDARAALIDTAGVGAFGYFRECAAVIAAELDEARRAVLAPHLIGKLILRSLERTMLLRDEEDDLADMGPDPTLFRVWPEDYPKQFRALLESATYYGVDGDAVICLEPRPGTTTKLWAISPTTGTDHGPIDVWIETSVEAIIKT